MYTQCFGIISHFSRDLRRWRRILYAGDDDVDDDDDGDDDDDDAGDGDDGDGGGDGDDY